MFSRHTGDSNSGLFLHRILVDIDHELVKRLQVVDIRKWIVALG